MLSPSQKLMNHHFISWKVVGLWPSTNERSQLYTAYSALITALFYIIFPLSMFLKLFFSNDIFEIVDIILFLPTAMAGLKAYLIVRKRSDILDLFEMMGKLDKQIDDGHNEFGRHTIHRRIRQSQRIIYTLACLYYTSTLCDYLSALMNSERILVWVSWYPFDPTARLEVYHGLLIYQFVATFYLATIIQSIDVFGGSIYCILGGHLEVLGARMEALGRRRQDIVRKWPPQRQSVQDQLKECESMLSDCIDVHHLCVR